jgi:hypothetical protein
MLPVLEHAIPDNDVFRRRLYEGEIFRLAATQSSARLVQDAWEVIERELGGRGSAREAQFSLTDDELFRRVGKIRKHLFLEDPFHRAVREIMADCGFDPSRNAFDPIRIRVVAHRGDENPKAAPVYYGHRDTWYAHSQAQLTWWIPLHDVTEDETFVFYPEVFARPIGNDSEDFDYDQWTRDGWGLKIGWQDPKAGMTARYPGQKGELDPGPPLGFAARGGEIVLFAGAQFHKTVPNRTGRTRFSLDFRTVHLDDDARGIGAPNADNRSRGSALKDYVQPPHG